MCYGDYYLTSVNLGCRRPLISVYISPIIKFQLKVEPSPTKLHIRRNNSTSGKIRITATKKCLCSAAKISTQSFCGYTYG